MRLTCESKTVYIDFLGCHYDNKEDAERSNHEIHLEFRKYIAEELIRTFSDGKVDMLATTQAIWQGLEFTPECVKNIYEVMKK